MLTWHGMLTWRSSPPARSVCQVTGYAHGAAELLGIQVDAAINSGNSGGPAFNDRGG